MERVRQARRQHFEEHGRLGGVLTLPLLLAASLYLGVIALSAVALGLLF
jgi:hypothetical protein